MNSFLYNPHYALFAGTFQIFHSGHIDILIQAAKIFEHVYVAVSFNPNKLNCSPINERLLRTQKIVEGLNLKNVSVIKNNGFGVISAKLYNCGFLIRGIRNSIDLDYEIQLATRNQELCNQIRTVFIVAKNELIDVSASKLLKKIN